MSDDAGLRARQVRGRVTRVADVALPGRLEAALVRSPVAAGRLRAIETSVATAMPGVVAVLTGAHLGAHGLDTVRFGTIVRDQPILALERVRHAGEPVAIVIAESRRQASAAARTVRVDVAPDEPLLDPGDALAPGARRIHPERPDNVLARWGFGRGDLAEARARAAHVFEGRWTSPSAQVVSFEPHAVVAHWPHGAGLELWSTTQSPSRVAQELARIFGLDEASVRLHVPPLGGAFGGKNHAKLEPLVAFAARVVGRPVRFVNTRAEEFVTVTKHPMTVDLETGVDRDGRFIYRSARVVAGGGAYAISSPVIPRAAGGAVLGPYRLDAAAVDAVVAYTEEPPAGSFRGLGVSQVAWASEQQVDEIARALGVDPVHLRRRNLVDEGDRLAHGDPARDAHWRACLEAVAGTGAGPSVATDAQSGVEPAWRRRGRGVAVSMKATMAPSRTDVRLVLRRDGVVEVRSSAVEMGQGAKAVLARLASEALDVPVEHVHVVDPDTALTPFDATTSSSRTTAQHAAAIERAAESLRERVRALAATLAEGAARPGLRDGRIRDEQAGLDLSLEAFLAAVGAGSIEVDASHVNEPAGTTGQAELTTAWHQGAVAAEVEVDTGTGQVRVTALRGAAWAGRVVDPAGARLQDEGNLVYGLGPTLFEEILAVDGLPTNANLRDYRIPSLRDVPLTLAVAELAASDPRAEPHGLGESLVTAVAPAIGNAVADALGIHVRDLPLTPSRVLRAIDAACGAPRPGRHR